MRKLSNWIKTLINQNEKNVKQLTCSIYIANYRAEKQNRNVTNKQNLEMTNNLSTRVLILFKLQKRHVFLTHYYYKGCATTIKVWIFCSDTLIIWYIIILFGLIKFKFDKRLGVSTFHPRYYVSNLILYPSHFVCPLFYFGIS